jgi:hypothetical protein
MVSGVINRIDQFPKLLTALPGKWRHQTSTRSERRSRKMRVADDACRSENKKKPGAMAGLFCFPGPN